MGLFTIGLYKTKTFAQLCGTTKETLRHYRDIGILIPHDYTETGYALYSNAQISDFYLIAALRSTGYSLGEIKMLFETHSSDTLKETLIKKATALKRTREELARNEFFLRGAARTLELFDHPSTNTITIEDQEAEWFFTTQLPDLDENNATALKEGDLSKTSTWQQLVHHLEQCTQQSRSNVLQFSYRMGIDALRSGDYGADISVCSKTKPNFHDASTRPLLYKREAGTYLTLISVIDLLAIAQAIEEGEEIPDPFLEVFATFDAYGRTHDLTLIGDMLVTELSLGSLLESGYGQQFRCEASIQIEPN